VSAETRARVFRIASEVGYRPSRSARSLRSAKTGTIGLLSPDLENPVAYDHLRATVRAAFDAGYTVFVGDGQGSPEIQEAEVTRMREYRVDGLIIGRGILPVTRGLIDVVASGVPVEPSLGEAAELESRLGSVITPYPERAELDAAAATIGYRRLLELGHRRFAFFNQSPGPTELGRKRYKSLTDLLAQTPREAHVTLVSTLEPSECVAEMQHLAAGPDRPTAVISGSGRLTPHILEGIHSSGLSIPGDVSFLCFGDSPWLRAYTPPLAVVRHDYAAAALRSVQLLVARIEGRELEVVARRPSQFLARNSIGPAPGASPPRTSAVSPARDGRL
jgi:LacI family transcriptional regulator